jgi:hypothetical protein
MANLAEFESTPPGTVYRPNPDSGWTDALVGDLLENEYESDNIQGNNYQVRLLPNAEIWFKDPATVSLSNLSGVVEYKDPKNGWKQVGGPDQCEAVAVKTGDQGSVSLVLLARGGYRPPEWD